MSSLNGVILELGSGTKGPAYQLPELAARSVLPSLAPGPVPPISIAADIPSDLPSAPPCALLGPDEVISAEPPARAESGQENLLVDPLPGLGQLRTGQSDYRDPKQLAYAKETQVGVSEGSGTDQRKGPD